MDSDSTRQRAAAEEEATRQFFRYETGHHEAFVRGALWAMARDSQADAVTEAQVEAVMDEMREDEWNLPHRSTIRRWLEAAMRARGS